MNPRPCFQAENPLNFAFIEHLVKASARERRRLSKFVVYQLVTPNH